MPLQLPNIPYPNLQFPTQPTGGQGIAAGLAGGLEKGMDAYKAMQLYQQQLEKNKVDTALKQAQTQQALTMANLPFGGKIMPGPAGQVQGVEMIGKYYGYDSPQYKQAKSNLDLSQKAKQTRMDYETALTNSMPERYLTQTGRSIVEGQRVERGLAPTGQQWENIVHNTSSKIYNNLNMQGGDPQTNAIKTGQATTAALNPESSNQLKGVYNLLLQKGTTDTDARKRNLYAANVEKTLSQINPDDLVAYGGFWGKLREGYQQGRSMFELETEPQFDRSKIAAQNAELLATQVRQFYGDSIQPAMLARLELLTNPATWKTNPKLAKKLFDATTKVLRLEMKTYRDAMKSTAPYTGEDQGVVANIPSSMTGGKKPISEMSTAEIEAELAGNK